MMRVSYLLFPVWLFLPAIAIAVIPISAAGQSDRSDDLSEFVSRLDVALETAWRDGGWRAARDATDGEWCRRVYLDILGRIPTVAEYQSFVTQPERDKKARLVRELLYDERYRDEYADQWSTVWTNILLGRTGGLTNNSLANREGMTQYLAACFDENRSYSQMVAELITATGANRPGTDGFNGAVNFLCDKLADKATQATAQTARIFLGIRLQCTQCHNHPFNEWKQEGFWQLNSFFRQAVPLRRYAVGTSRVAYVELADQDFAGEGNTPEEAEVYFEQRDGILRVAYPVFLDGQPLSNRSGFVEDIRRRDALAEMIVASPNFAEAVVNRYWSYFLGYGLVEPIDDFGPHREATHPEVLKLLANEFRAGGYDFKQLISWIALSRPYALSSRPATRRPRDDPQAGTSPAFSRFYLRQLRPEDLYRSMMVVSYFEHARANDVKHRPTRLEFTGQFVQALGDDEGNETTAFNGTIPQTLMMFNGPLLDAALRLDADSLLGNIATSSSMDFEQQVAYLFRATLAREPTQRELRAAQQQQAAWGAARPATNIRPRGSDRPPPALALQDVMWALVNSNEFLLNH